jgi:glutamate 5-kinase
MGMRIVVKVGSSSLTDENGFLRTDVVSSIVDQIADVRGQGHEVLLVTSGAIASGVAGLGMSKRPSDVLTLQALSAVGQPQLMAAYGENFARHSLVSAQVLLVPHDFVNRQQYLHARNTLLRLLELGCVPIVNENDAIANTEIRYGDNDHLSALLAHLVSADMLIMLTDTPGLYTEDPRSNPHASIIHEVHSDDPLLSVRATGSGSTRGSGGMASKLAAARIASWSGVTAVIASASVAHVLARIVSGEKVVGTVFHPRDRQLSARKLWIAFAAEVEGTVVVDDGARIALTTRGTSLLPAGVIDSKGAFDDGATVEIVDRNGEIIARGMTAMSSLQLQQARGRTSADIAHMGVVEVVHRDDLVVLK